MPKSRQRPRRSSRPYAPPRPRRRPKASPRWYGFLVLGLIVAGVAIIVWNYMRGDAAQNMYLWIGLGVIALGFGAATQWR